VKEKASVNEKGKEGAKGEAMPSSETDLFHFNFEDDDPGKEVEKRVQSLLAAAKRSQALSPPTDSKKRGRDEMEEKGGRGNEKEDFKTPAKEKAKSTRAQVIAVDLVEDDSHHDKNAPSSSSRQNILPKAKEKVHDLFSDQWDDLNLGEFDELISTSAAPNTDRTAPKPNSKKKDRNLIDLLEEEGNGHDEKQKLESPKESDERGRRSDDFDPVMSTPYLPSVRFDPSFSLPWN